MNQRPSLGTSGASKTEPKATAISPKAVADIGLQTTQHAMSEGRGYTAPKASTSTHPSGSQGRHK